MDTLPQRVGEQTVSKRSHAPKDPKPAWPCHQDIHALSNTRAHPPILSSGMSSKALSGRCPPFALHGRLYVIPEGAGTVNPCEEDRLVVVCHSSVQAGSRQSADGVRVERPQRSEDERPWGRQGLTQDGIGGVRLPGSMACFR